MKGLTENDKQRGNYHDEPELSVIRECYCPACQGGNATTTVLPTKVPYFREIIVMNLFCSACGYRSAQVSFTGAIQDKGQRIKLTVTRIEDLNRQIVKSDSASLFLPAVNLEIPASTQRGKISTLEGILTTTADHLATQQSERLQLGDVDNFHRCRAVISKLRRWTGQTDIILEDESSSSLGYTDSSIFPFDVILDDPAGNSFIENFQAPKRDPHLTHVQYTRTPDQDVLLGLSPPQLTEENPEHAASTPQYRMHRPENQNSRPPEHWDLKGEVMKFPTACPNCRCPTETDMCLTHIPHFQDVILMCMICAKCGFRSTNIQGNCGAISEHGTRFILNVTNKDDLCRDVLKSDTAAIQIPELDLEVEGGSLGGLYTTVEGLLTKIVDHLVTSNPFGIGDSAEQRDGSLLENDLPGRYRAFLKKMRGMIQGQHLPFQLIISDPLSNSFVGPRLDECSSENVTNASGNLDRNLVLERYDRTHAENEVLGLNDIMTECS